MWVLLLLSFYFTRVLFPSAPTLFCWINTKKVGQERGESDGDGEDKSCSCWKKENIHSENIQHDEFNSTCKVNLNSLNGNMMEPIYV